MLNIKNWSLSKFRLFESLPKEDIDKIDQMAPDSNIKTLTKGTIVQTPEVDCNGLFIVIEGRIRLFKQILMENNIP